MSRRLDVAVVGAGPAGCSAAITLARRGHRVRLIDKARFPRDKVCGDWLTGGALAGLAALGIDRRALLAAGARPIAGNRLYAPNGRSHEAAGGSLCLPRLIFDDLLYRAALDAGCAPETRAVRDLAAEARACDALIDARGVYGGAANTVALRHYLAVPLDRAPAASLDRVHLFTDGTVRLGYGWIFPARATDDTLTVNLGVGLWKAAQRGADSGGEDVRAYLARFLASNPLARALRAAAVEVDRPRGHHLALVDRRAIVAHGRVLRVGDAANLTDPITGEGIANAIDSGVRAAELLDAAPDVAAAGRAWQAHYDGALLPRLRAAWRIRRLLGSTARKNTALALLRRSPAMARRFHHALEGTADYGAIVPRPLRPLARALAPLSAEGPWRD